jgi:hypothetical protein
VLTFDGARRIAVNFAKLPRLLGWILKQKKPRHKGQAPPVPRFPHFPPRSGFCEQTVQIGRSFGWPKKS